MRSADRMTAVATLPRRPARERNGDAVAAKRVLDYASEAIRALGETLNGDFSRAVDILYGVKGRVVVSGMGKSGHIGRKIAATLSSTGTPAQFIHPGEASHGDPSFSRPRPEESEWQTWRSDQTGKTRTERKRETGDAERPTLEDLETIVNAPTLAGASGQWVQPHF